ncbi:fluoride efflux transporter CrcB [Halomonas sp. MC140]|nr:fluoride efflux transporter CrcB [Halomonas sp. MC140]MDN7133046.1 fluoride efflux transporter CrcB [Halomonas sp. MC140]
MGQAIVNMLLVALGGAVGGMSRFAISSLLAKHLGSAFPWGTLAVNLSGSIAAGWLLGTLGLPNSAADNSLWLVLVVGGLGGYTTVSSFSLQTLELWQRGEAVQAAVNIVATVLLGLVGLYFGWQLAGGSV